MGQVCVVCGVFTNRTNSQGRTVCKRHGGSNISERTVPEWVRRANRNTLVSKDYSNAR